MSATSVARIVDVRWYAVHVSPRTCWSFIELQDASGGAGLGEATLAGSEREMATILASLRQTIIDRVPAYVDLTPVRSHARTLPEFAVVSALDQALRDLDARQRGISVGDALGERVRDRVALYANINRAATLRTPEGFAALARHAVGEGHVAVKIAPFDGIALYGDIAKPMDRDLLDAGLARIAAVRNVIGPDVDLLVDCHWRLNRSAAETVIRAVESYRLHWLECPVPETPETLDTLRALRRLANDRGIRLAGCETTSRIAGFLPYLQAGAYDVMMPDVKYVGGLQEMLDVAVVLQHHGVEFSPHNPSGPVCHAASLQVCATTRDVGRLEIQYRETPLFEDLVGGAIARATLGKAEIPRTPGLGVRLDQNLVRALRAPPEDAVAG